MLHLWLSEVTVWLPNRTRSTDVLPLHEKREDKARKAYLVAISGLIAKRFPSVTDETSGRAEQLLEIMELHLALFDCNYLEDYYEGAFLAIRAEF